MTTELAQANTRAAEWLAERSPRQASEALASLAQSHGVSYREEYEITFSRVGDNGETIPAREPRLLGYKVNGPYSEELASRAQRFLTPAPMEVIERWLAELSVITAKRADDDFSEELRLTAYTRRLQEYPADIVRHVLLDMKWKFWPTWQELSQKLDAMTMQRRALVRSISSARSGHTSDNEGQHDLGRTETPEEREARRQKRERVAEVAKETLKNMRRRMGVNDFPRNL